MNELSNIKCERVLYDAIELATLTGRTALADELRSVLKQVQQNNDETGVLDIPRASAALVMREPFCVIGRSVLTDRTIDRTWQPTKERGEAHASNLMARHPNKVDELLVVRVVSVVRKRRDHEVIDVAQ